MAQFRFEIVSEDEGEMAGLMRRLFVHDAYVPRAATTDVNPSGLSRMSEVAPDDGDAYEEEAPANPEPPRRKRRTKAEMDADKEVVAEDDPAEDEPASEVTLDMVKAVGSKAMGVIKASGVAAILKAHGGGAESFGGIDPATYGAVYTALNEALA